jgi:type II secretion system protein J
MKNRGFTIIEVLISLVILSIITLITTNILKSSLDTELATSKYLNSIKTINLSSSKIRRDLRQIVNITSRDFYGNKMDGSFIYDEGADLMIFNSYTKSYSNEVSPIKRIEYQFKDNSLIRKQYFSSNPYNQDQFIESTLLTNLNTYNVSLLSTNKWHPSWPINSITSSKIPRLIKMEFTQNNKQYTWIIEPNISYANN